MEIRQTEKEWTKSTDVWVDKDTVGYTTSEQNSRRKSRLSSNLETFLQ